MNLLLMYCITRRVAAVCVLFSLFIIYMILPISAGDPTSIFFSAKKGYASQYSSIRRQEAEMFISSYDPTLEVNVMETGNEKRQLCVGIPSVGRQGVQYLRDTVGSLLQGLTSQERSEIYLMVLIAHSDPASHPAYGEEWLHGLTDYILTYEFADDKIQHIRDMEAEGGLFKEKGLFDYSYLLSKCAQQSTPYVAVFEDDTLAMDGWYHRTIAAISVAEQQTALKHAKPDFLYLRLFYTEVFLGWNSEEWRTYLYCSLWLAALPSAILFLLHAIMPAAKLSRALGSCHAVFTIYASLAILIILFFALGRLTVFPIPAGVHEMSQFGCCAQAFVFPNQKALDLVSYFEVQQTGFVDVLAEKFANERDELRFAIVLSVVQHVGRTSSKMGSHGPIMKQKVWSFAFEKHDQLKLREEHAKVARK